MLDKRRAMQGFAMAKRAGILQRVVESEQLDGRTILLDGREMINFASCGYLGIEFDARLQEATIDAVRRFGTQFSSSRVYLSAPLYHEAEELLSEICGRPAMLAPTTSLGHQSALPVLIGPKDTVLMDQHVHNSVQVAAYPLRLRGAKIVSVTHNDAAMLARKVAAAAAAGGKVWYLMDGLYSMFGSIAPFDALEDLLARFPGLHIYCDDAHGTGWHGARGEGFSLSRWADHPRVISALSLNKSFACAGGVIAFPTGAMMQTVRDFGESINFSGPVQPPMLGAIVASARLHLSGELAPLQAALRDRIALFNTLVEDRGLVLAYDGLSPIRYIRVGSTARAIECVAELARRGFYVNVASYPAVAERDAGVRITLTNHQRPEDIAGLLDNLAELIPAPGAIAAAAAAE